MEGNATFVIVASRMTMNCARQTRTRTSQRFVSGRVGAGAGSRSAIEVLRGLLVGLRRDGERGRNLRGRRKGEGRRRDVQVLAEQPVNHAGARRESRQRIQRATMEMAHTPLVEPHPLELPAVALREL